jgi:preprotein translocase subunit SecA
MFKSSFTADTIALQPGLLSGKYPEKADQNKEGIEAICRMMQGRLMALTSHSTVGLKKVVKAIDRQGKELSVLQAEKLDQRLARLRQQLRIRGMSVQLCAQSFALIREMAARTLKLKHYDTQLMAGWTILHGQLAEMETGEGKTLAATLAAATAAFAGIPVHILTVNEYLVERDAQTMEPLYRALGLTTGFVTQSMTEEQRRAGYACDIVYTTNKQVAFDYLRDRLVLGNTRSRMRIELESAYADNSRAKQLLLRGLCFAIIDEADSILIDEARTPLILTRSTDNTTEHSAYCKALELAGQLKNDRDFIINSGQGHAQLTLAGQQQLNEHPLAQDGLLKHSRLREELITSALHALYLLHKDKDYLVHEEKILIIDANTGRTMPDRSWERGLHQMVEAKENCPLTCVNEHLGRLTYQRFFRRYLRLGGMTGTAREVSSELWSVYRLRVKQTPLHRPGRRQPLPTRVYNRQEEKWDAVLASVRECQNQGRPILIGTGSVADSEVLSLKLTRAHIAHQVLNARQDKEEAQIVAAAGRKRQVTVATNMAGRGTDIPLGEGVAECGGLHVLATCCNESRRIDRQLYGRCARQGDPGSHQTLLSLEDELVVKNCRPAQLKMLKRSALRRSRSLQHLSKALIKRAQKRIERRHRDARKILLQHDRQTGQLLAFSGHME